jgi:hypothetical protein
MHRKRSFSPELLPSDPETAAYLLNQAIEAMAKEHFDESLGLLDQAIQAMKEYYLDNETTDELCILELKIYNLKLNTSILQRLTNNLEDSPHNVNICSEICHDVIRVYAARPAIPDTDYQVAAAMAYLLSGYLQTFSWMSWVARIEKFAAYTRPGMEILDTILGAGHEGARAFIHTHSRFLNLTFCYYYISDAYAGLCDGQLCLSNMQRSLIAIP